MELADVDRETLLRLFFEEAEEGLQAMEQALMALEESPQDVEPKGTLFRVAHTLKGNAVSLGFSDLASMTHALEDVLDALRSGSVVANRDVIDLLLESVDALRELLSEAKG